MATNDAELNAHFLHRAWEVKQRRESKLLSMNDSELNAACL